MSKICNCCSESSVGINSANLTDMCQQAITRYEKYNKDCLIIVGRHAVAEFGEYCKKYNRCCYDSFRRIFDSELIKDASKYSFYGGNTIPKELSELIYEELEILNKIIPGEQKYIDQHTAFIWRFLGYYDNMHTRSYEKLADFYNWYSLKNHASMRPYYKQIERCKILIKMAQDGDVRVSLSDYEIVKD